MSGDCGTEVCVDPRLQRSGAHGAIGEVDDDKSKRMMMQTDQHALENVFIPLGVSLRLEIRKGLPELNFDSPDCLEWKVWFTTSDDQAVQTHCGDQASERRITSAPVSARLNAITPSPVR